MSAWRTAPLGFNSPSLEAILRQIEYLTRNTSEGLAPAVEAVEALVEVLEAADPSKLDVTLALDFGGNAAAAHIYPSQQYQVDSFRFRRWTGYVERSFLLLEDRERPFLIQPPCIDFPAQLLAFVVASGDFGSFVDLARRMRELFGFLISSAFDVHDQLTLELLNAKVASCRPLDEHMPVLAEIRNFLNTSVTLSASPALRTLHFTLLSKARKLVTKLVRIQRILDAISDFNMPEVRFLSVEVSSLANVGTALSTASNAPLPDEFVAGSVFLVDTPTGVTMEALFAPDSTVSTAETFHEKLGI